MASGHAGGVARDLDVLATAGTVAGLSDAELLRRFTTRRDAAAELAFEAIVARHGRMVLGVCRQVLRGSSDVDDAFQATFLVLVRRAGSVRVGPSLGPWLYSVACRVARKARTNADRRRRREGPGGSDEPAAPADATDAIDVRPLLHEELNRLPEKYRSPVVLCHLEGMTHEEAARQLRWPVGTVSGRLSRARELLRARLSRRGLGVTASAVAAALAPTEATAAISPALLGATARAASRLAAGGAVSASVWKLSQGVLTAMFLHKLKAGIGIATVVAFLAVGAGYVAGQVQGVEKPESAPPRQDNSPATRPTGGLPPAASPPAAVPPEVPPRAPLGPGNAGGGIQLDVTAPSIPGFPKWSKERLSPFARPTVPGLRTDRLMMVASPDGRTFQAMTDRESQWHAFKVPDGLASLPFMSQDVLALAFSGREVRELAVFSGPDEGSWSVKALEKPFDGEVVPVVGEGVAVYTVGRDLYLFRAPLKTWFPLRLSDGGPPTMQIERNRVLVLQGKTLHVFNYQAGAWSPGIETQLPAPIPPGFQ